ncbi:flavodoxin family protein [Micromonospora sp. NPDC005189]|uniref:flavodoxin family protein n=1 Tax=unclassified Micromonospora TaxID=2617518 RepID=UPI0033A128EF
MGGAPTVVAINGSERVGGNTAEVLKYAAGRFAARGVRLDVVGLARKTFTSCGPCGECNTRTEPCLLRDDMPDIVRRMVEADGIIYATPVHGFGTASMMQQFIERAGVGYLRFERPLTNKVAGVVVVGRRYSHVDVHAQLLHNVMLNRMLLAGSGFPAVIHAGERGEALADREGVDAVTRLVDRMTDLIQLLHEHRRITGHGLPVPATNERVLR